MKFNLPQHLSVLLAVAALGWTGCINLEPSVDKTRYFVLSHAEAGASPQQVKASDDSLGVGVGPVGLPSFFRNHMVVRMNNNELKYLRNYQWAERLDKGIQRVIAVRLRQDLQTENVLLDSWQRGEVQYEVYVTFPRLEVTQSGEVTMEALWQVLPPGDSALIHAQNSIFQKQGQPPETNPESTVGLFSEGLEKIAADISSFLKKHSQGT